MMFRTLAACLLLATTAVAEDRALVIGIDDYSAVPDALSLNGAVNDAERMSDFLTRTLGFSERGVTRLTNAAASADAILTALIDTVVRETNPNDRVVLFFAGLGTVLPDGTPALVAHDGDSVLGQIPMATISEILGVIRDRQITVILDAGFDGGPIGARGHSGGIPSGPLDLGPGVTVWTASQLDQFAWEQLDHGVFIDAFIKGATQADANHDGSLTNGEMLAHVKASLQRWCDENAPCTASGRGLAPKFEGFEGEEFLSVSAPEKTAEIETPIEIDDGAPASLRETLGFVTDLFAPSNEARLTLSIKGGDAMRVGEFVTFTASADRPGTLLLLDVDPMGQLAQVYPSKLVAEGGTRVSPGQPLIIPNALGANGRPLRIRVTEPAGQGLLLGLFIEGDLPQLTALLPAGIAGGPVQNAGQSLFEISQSLLRLEADPEQPVAWSATYLPYRIEP